MAWIKKTRDTGWRNVSAWVPNRVSGRLLIRRTEHEMVVALDELVLSVGGSVAFERLPSGLRPMYRIRGAWFPSVEATPGGSLNISGGGYFNVHGVVAGQSMSARITGDFTPGAVFPSPTPGDPA